MPNGPIVPGSAVEQVLHKVGRVDGGLVEANNIHRRACSASRGWVLVHLQARALGLSMQFTASNSKLRDNRSLCARNRRSTRRPKPSADPNAWPDWPRQSDRSAPPCKRIASIGCVTITVSNCDHRPICHRLGACLTSCSFLPPFAALSWRRFFSGFAASLFAIGGATIVVIVMTLCGRANRHADPATRCSVAAHRPRP